jgi:hypothetical protein
MHCRSGHFFALLGATLTLVSAALAVFRVVLSTLLGAGMANFRANAGYFGSEFRTGRQKQGCRPAERGAIAIERNASSHHLDVVLTQAFACTVGALVRAMITGFNTIKEFVPGHNISPFPSRSEIAGMVVL